MTSKHVVVPLIVARRTEGDGFRQNHDSDGSPYEKRVDSKGRVLSDVCIADEVPFEKLPEGWAWARLESVIDIASNLVCPREYESVQHVAPDNIEKESGKLLDCRTVLEDGVKSANHRFSSGQILYSKIRPALRKATIAPFDGLCSADMYPLDSHLDTSFTLTLVLGDVFTRQVLKGDTRVKMPKTNQKALRIVLLPIPPLAEQRRRLVAEKKMKAPKGGESVIYTGSDGRRYEKRVDARGRESEPSCIEDEIPFEIPESWEWARLGSIGSLLRGSGIKRSEVVPHGKPCIRYGELYTTYDGAVEQVSSHVEDKIYDAAKKLESGEVLITLTGENNVDIGRAVHNATGETLAFGGDLLAVKGHCMLGEFLALAINSPAVALQRTKAASGNIIVHLSTAKASMFLIPVPPIDEQRRIIEQIQELAPLMV